MEYNDLIRGLAQRFGMEVEQFAAAVKAQCFDGGAASDYQLTQFMMVAANRQLNPFEQGEIYCFVNKKGKLTIGTGRDGWTKIAHRHPHFKGFRHAEVVGKDGEFLGIHMEMFRDDWQLPGEYTAYLEEWNKQVLNAEGWKNQPRHLTFVKAWQECTKITFAVTEIATEEEIEYARQEDGAIRQPAPEPQRTLEHQPVEPAPFLRTTAEHAEKVETHNNPARSDGHLRVHVELPGENNAQPAADAPAGGLAANPGEPTPTVGAASEPAASAPAGGAEAQAGASPATTRRGRPAGSRNKPKLQANPMTLLEQREAGVICWVCDAQATETISDMFGPTYGTCADHKGQEPPDFKARCEAALKAGGGGVTASQGRPAGNNPHPPSASDAQAAAGLEQIDPNESPLETFIRAHDVPARRVEMALSKYDALKVGDLTPEQANAVLGIFQRSYQMNQATQ